MTGTFQEELASRLRHACHAARAANAAIALSRGGERFVVGSGSSDDDPHFTGATSVRLGCLAKPLTATLVSRLLSRTHDVTLDSPIGPALSCDEALLSGVTLTHLLNHSHGLQDSYRNEVPRDTGYINIPGLLADVRENGRLFAPGRTYSYGNIGYWLIGALIERLQQRSLRDALDDELLRPLGISNAASGDGFCPSFGGDAALSAEALLRITETQLTDDAGYRELRTRTVAYPGWIATSRASPCGWVDYGEGWYGQNSILDEQSAVIRFSPQKQIAFVVTSHSTKSFQVMASVFGEVLPELTRSPHKPRALPEAEVRAHDWSKYIGDYEGPAARIGVRRSPRTHLPLQLTLRRRNAQPIVIDLRPAEHGVFYGVPGAPGFASVQFVTLEDGAAPLLWNGTHLWRSARGDQVNSAHLTREE